MILQHSGLSTAMLQNLRSHSRMVFSTFTHHFKDIGAPDR